MKGKIAVVTLLLVATAAPTFGQAKAHLQGGLSFMYVTYESPEVPGIPYVGATCDLLIAASQTVELGMELGLYQGFGYLVIIIFSFNEMPIDALVRLNLSPDRKVAIELRGGLWISMVTAETLWGTSRAASVLRPHAGARILLDWFYFGADYFAPMEMLGSAVSFEIGGKKTLF